MFRLRAWTALVLGLAAGLALAGVPARAAAAARAFPQHQAYAPGSIKPSHLPQAALDAQVSRVESILEKERTGWIDGIAS